MRLTQPSRHRDRRRHTRGQSLVELALILPVMLLLLLTALDLGRVLYSQITVTNAAKEGALVASQGGTFQSGQGCADTNTVMCGVLTEAEGGFVEVVPARVSLSAVCEKNAMWPGAGGPPVVTVTVRAPFQVLTPIIGNIIGNNLLLTATADAQCLVVPQVTYPSVPPPVAAFTATPTSGAAPLTVAVDASASHSTGSTITDWSWSFGASGETSSTTYNAAGTFTITLTVTDNRGATDTASQTITVTGGGPPPPACPTVSIAVTPVKNKPFQRTFDATLSPNTNGWSWAWTYAPGTVIGNGNGNSIKVDFNTSGTYQVGVTATKGSCVVTTPSQSVVIP